MQQISSNADVRLLELAKALRGDPGDNYVLHFGLSRLAEDNRSDFQLKIAFNVLNDVFREAEGSILFCDDGDIFVVYHGSDRLLLEKAIFQLRYLFVDDAMATRPDGSENPEFCLLYDLTFQWRELFEMANARMESRYRRQAQAGAEEDERVRAQRAATVTKGPGGMTTRGAAKIMPLDPEGLVEIVRQLRLIDISHALRTQPVSALRKGEKQEDMRSVFSEIYINISHLTRLIGLPYNLLSERSLFKYITKELDFFVLETIGTRPKIYLSRPISLNLNIQTVQSDVFEAFTKSMASLTKSIVLELHVEDVFDNIYAFNEVRQFAQQHGYRICLDGLNELSVLQIDRSRLGFDLAKLQWNAEMAGDLEAGKNVALKDAVHRCGPNRIILCRCDSTHAIDYGHALGISLFQGRYPDKVLNPRSKVVN